MVYRDVNFMCLFLQHDLNGRNTIYFFMHKTALACHTHVLRICIEPVAAPQNGIPCCYTLII